MVDMKLKSSTVEVPKNTGLEGFLHTIRQILKLPRVQSLTVDAKGRITYDRYVTEEEKPLVGNDIDFSGIEPWHLVRNCPDEVEELILDSCNASVVLVSLFDRASSERLHPVAFVTGQNSALWEWYKNTTGYPLASKTHLCGLPVYGDRHLPDSALILATSFSREGSLVDTQKAYKIEMEYFVVPATEVEVLDVQGSGKDSH